MQACKKRRLEDDQGQIMEVFFWQNDSLAIGAATPHSQTWTTAEV